MPVQVRPRAPLLRRFKFRRSLFDQCSDSSGDLNRTGSLQIDGIDFGSFAGQGPKCMDARSQLRLAFRTRSASDAARRALIAPRLLTLTRPRAPLLRRFKFRRSLFDQCSDSSGDLNRTGSLQIDGIDFGSFAGQGPKCMDARSQLRLAFRTRSASDAARRALIAPRLLTLTRPRAPLLLRFKFRRSQLDQCSNSSGDLNRTGSLQKSLASVQKTSILLSCGHFQKSNWFAIVFFVPWLGENILGGTCLRCWMF